MTYEELTAWVEHNAVAVQEAARNGDGLAVNIWLEAWKVLQTAQATGDTNTDDFIELVHQWETRKHRLSDVFGSVDSRKR
jgi:hypothetical protein